ncbi:MAG: SIMPL domain-containing protein [Spirochaetes bacterium]|nr:SIMPL domain-containing protein [Spirochaetota bacterium]
MKIIGILALVAAVFTTACVPFARERSVIVVSGVGTVMIQPDTVQMTIVMGRTARTIREAQEGVSLMVRQALRILQTAGIEEKNINTASLRFFPEYDWGPSGRILLGQRAEQVITFSVGNIHTNQEKISGIIDQLILIEGIALQHMHFSVEDNTALFARSRELAYQKALEKAEQYARLSNQRIVRVISISEDGLAPVSPILNRAFNVQTVALSADSGAAGTTVLPTGEIEITSRITVEFLVR